MAEEGNLFLRISKTDPDIFQAVSEQTKGIRIFLSVYITGLFAGLFYLGYLLAELILPGEGTLNVLFAAFYSGISVVIIREMMNIQLSKWNLIGSFLIVATISSIATFALQYKIFNEHLVEFRTDAIRLQLPEQFAAIDSLRDILANDSVKNTAMLKTLQDSLQKLKTAEQSSKLRKSKRSLEAAIIAIEKKIELSNNATAQNDSLISVRNQLNRLETQIHSEVDTSGIFFYFEAINLFGLSSGANALNMFLIQLGCFVTLFLGSILNYGGIGGEYYRLLNQRREKVIRRITQTADDYLAQADQDPHFLRQTVTEDFDRIIEGAGKEQKDGI